MSLTQWRYKMNYNELINSLTNRVSDLKKNHDLVNDYLELGTLTLEQAFFCMRFRHDNNWIADLHTLVNSRTKSVNIGLEFQGLFRLIDLPSDDEMWLTYARKVKCMSQDEFSQIYAKSKVLTILDIYNSKVIDTNRSFTLIDEDGVKTTMTERQLEFWFNVDEPHSSDWTPYFCTEDMKEMKEGLENFTDLKIIE